MAFFHLVLLMPYDASDKESLPANVQAMGKADREQWVAVWNNSYAACIADDGKKGECETKAFKIANGVLAKKEKGHNMNPLQKLWATLRAAFAEAGVAVDEAVLGNQRVIAGSQLSTKVREQLEQMNAGAYKMDPQTGGMYMDWNEYLSPMDIYYDTDGSLFALCSRAGKLFRIPITVSDDGEEVTLGELVEIPLTGRTTHRSSIQVLRQADGAVRWFAIAASAVLNRVGEIDSTQLFDNFIRRAQENGRYPFLSFYHETGVIRLGQADWLGRSEYLYLASGTFDATPDGEAAQNTLERDTAGVWGNSIGYNPLGVPEMMEVAEGIRVPVYNDGTNEEISIVLERDAAAYYTRASAEEVQRAMSKNEYDALVLMFGKPRADELAANIDGTNRSIEQAGQIRREGDTAVAAVPPAVVAAATVADTTTNSPAVVAAEVTTEAAIAAPSAAVFEIPEDMFEALAQALTAKVAPLVQSGVDGLLATLNPRLEALEAGARTAQQASETRLAKLEQDEEAKRQEWVADLPAPKRVAVITRPREVRAGEQQVAPNFADVAQQTTSKMNTRQPAPAR